MIDEEILLDKILDSLEEIELRLLSWGITEVGFKEDELANIINNLISVLSEENQDLLLILSSEMIEKLLEKKLIFKINYNAENLFRTRMAETIRLMFSLRQLFPKHSQNDHGWQTAPTLVSDYRFIRRSRKFPN